MYKVFLYPSDCWYAEFFLWFIDTARVTMGLFIKFAQLIREKTKNPENILFNSIDEGKVFSN